MSKCPNCKKELETLTEDRVQRAYYQVNLSGDYQLNDYDDIISQDYYCPECDKKLDFITNEEQAIDFLNGAI